MRPTVFVTRPIIQGPLDRLAAVAEVQVHEGDELLGPDELRARVAGIDALFCHLTDRIDDALLEAAGPQLRIVANYAVGYNNIDLEACRRRGVAATNTPGVLTESTADIAFALLLATARRLVEGDRMVRAGQFDGWGPQMLLGHEIAGKTLGIIGCGRIGQAMARRARGFGMSLLYTQRRPLDGDLGRELGLSYVDLDTLLAQSDFISLHCPLTPETHHLLGRAQLARLKPEAILINTARGPVVDEKVLVEFLQGKRLAGAGFDVYEEEPRLAPGLAELDNVVLLPHIGSATFETRRRMGEMVVDNILAALQGLRPPNAL
ncbi:2-hydroxyacid dehydrogenase [Geoalkalibacter halelectricus]|uniref:D-glycerate dehydrogenase n=1 Tax=Geoalkalibacter halelectricus TaxID=2847045 RepID=A0ABY5ZQX0_9BACT|nr:D-glycerate dehydrogenase [Geoalkalibacter halelectricus]MDO3378598.1 D-glycerate dehydrogenase [Geoalkalibacter halelectricus]UWZ80089.1 D-glycerate dehydrogenase [Geoalkalibacter halelectricus]